MAPTPAPLAPSPAQATTQKPEPTGQQATTTMVTTAMVATTTTTPAPTPAPVPMKVSRAQVSMEISLTSAQNNSVEAAAQQAEADFRAKNSDLGADATVAVSTTSKVTTTASFNDPIPQTTVVSMFASVANVSLSDVTAEVALRRLGSARQLVSHEASAKSWHVAVVVKSSAGAQAAGAMLTNNETLMAEAAKQNVTAPVTEAPKLKVEITYTVTQKASANTTTAMPSDDDIQETAKKTLGAAAQAQTTLALMTTIVAAPTAAPKEETTPAPTPALNPSPTPKVPGATPAPTP